MRDTFNRCVNQDWFEDPSQYLQFFVVPEVNVIKSSTLLESNARFPHYLPQDRKKTFPLTPG